MQWNKVKRGFIFMFICLCLVQLQTRFVLWGENKVEHEQFGKKSSCSTEKLWFVCLPSGKVCPLKEQFTQIKRSQSTYGHQHCTKYACPENSTLIKDNVDMSKEILCLRHLNWKKMLLTYKDSNFVSILFSPNIFLTDHNSDRQRPLEADSKTAGAEAAIFLN